MLKLFRLFKKLFRLSKKKEIGSRIETNSPKDLRYNDTLKYIKVEGNNYVIRIDSIDVFKKSIEMQKEIEELQKGLSSNPEYVIVIIQKIKDMILMVLGKNSYEKIFDTEEKTDNYEWNLIVFEELFSKIIEYKMKQFNDIVNSEMLEKIKSLQASIKSNKNDIDIP